MTRLTRPTRRTVVLTGILGAAGIASLLRNPDMATAAEDPGLVSRFEELSRNGNSNCSRAFADKIASMPGMLRIIGSCCSPMDLTRYIEQTKGLTKYRAVAMIPPDPYDILAAIAQQAMSHYDVQLTGDEQKAYDYAMENSAEKGPCCCQRWRWKMYGGLAKYLIREHGFTGEQVVDVWNLSDGCGGGEELGHG